MCVLMNSYVHPSSGVTPIRSISFFQTNNENQNLLKNEDLHDHVTHTCCLAVPSF